jgi:putative RNA 2'-phosphotransferase
MNLSSKFVQECFIKAMKRNIPYQYHNDQFEKLVGAEFSYSTDEVVQTNNKKRFAFNEDKTLIRASQGHSIEIKLNLPAVTPPDTLYHGTAEKYLESILQTGLQKQTRQHVHLSATVETAKVVGSRHGKPVILIINAKAMYMAGLEFYLSENKVWLTDSVPVEYITQ